MSLGPKELFVLHELRRHGAYVSDLFKKSIYGRKLRFTDELLEGIDYAVDTGKPALVVSFPKHGRLVEINWHKRKRGLSTIDSRRLVWGIGKKKKPAKNAKWYAHNAYGSLNTLIGRVSWGYSEAVMQQMKEELAKAGFE